MIVPDAKEEAVRVVFLDSRPLLVTDDVRFKFYCSTVRRVGRDDHDLAVGGRGDPILLSYTITFFPIEDRPMW